MQRERNVKHFTTGLFVLSLAVGAIGCTGDVETTDDSVHLEADVPKVETGDKNVDLDPRTDDDVDIDTPLPGDK
jgi:hypothetical protein